jgi:hypothetical protein
VTELDSIIQDLRAECRESLMAVCKLLGFRDVNWRTHGKIIQVLESESTRKLICVPRGSLKSSICCVAYPLWRLIRNPNERIMIDSQLYTNSKTFIREIRGHLESTKWKAIWGDWKTDTWNESSIVIAARTRPTKEPSILASGLGAVKVGLHFDVIIQDDLSSWDNADTPEKAQKVIDHVRYNYSILEPGGVMIIVGTRYAENDAIGHVLANEECRFV